jgi:uncharacterized protein YcaQ
LPRVRTISSDALRRLVISAQDYVSRVRLADADDVEAAIRRAMCIQLDTVTAVERSHRIAIASRAGLYPRDTVPMLLREGRIIENWTHALCLVPAEDWPLYAWARARMRDGAPWHGDVRARYPGLADQVLGEIRERGPLGSKDFAGEADPAPHRAGTSSEVMWSWKPAKQMLDALFASGELVIAGRVNFHRLYDLPERVLPREVLDAPVPSEDEAVKALIVKAVRARGALREFAIAEHVRPIWNFLGGAKAARPYVESLVADGKLERVAVEDGGEPVVVEVGTELDRPRPGAAVLLSPFDNLLWGFIFRRVLGFEHVIELYKPAPQRKYGYYVLPFLWRDRIVGRADLKSERKEGALVVKSFHLEPGVRPSKALDEAFERALDRVRRIAGLEHLTRADR